MTIKTFYADTSQVLFKENFENTIRFFLEKAYEKEPNEIHEVIFLEDRCAFTEE